MQEPVQRMESVTSFFIQNDCAGNVTTRCVFPRDLRLIFGNVEADNLVLRVEYKSSLRVDNRSVANGPRGFRQRNLFRERPKAIAGALFVRSKRFRRKRRDVALGRRNRRRRSLRNAVLVTVRLANRLQSGIVVFRTLCSNAGFSRHAVWRFRRSGRSWRSDRRRWTANRRICILRRNLSARLERIRYAARRFGSRRRRCWAFRRLWRLWRLWRFRSLWRFLMNNRRWFWRFRRYRTRRLWSGRSWLFVCRRRGL